MICANWRASRLLYRSQEPPASSGTAWWCIWCTQITKLFMGAMLVNKLTSHLLAAMRTASRRLNGQKERRGSNGATSEARNALLGAERAGRPSLSSKI